MKQNWRFPRLNRTKERDTRVRGELQFTHGNRSIFHCINPCAGGCMIAAPDCAVCSDLCFIGGTPDPGAARSLRTGIRVTPTRGALVSMATRLTLSE